MRTLFTCCLISSVCHPWSVAVIADERSDVGGNRAVAASAGDSIVISGVLTEREEGCCPA